ncbi:unnamed protein product, partial [Brassica rapa subsp. trilocularis]
TTTSVPPQRKTPQLCWKSTKPQPHQTRHNEESPQPRRESTKLQPHQSRHNVKTPQLCWKIRRYTTTTNQREELPSTISNQRKSISCTELFIWKGDSQNDCHTH